MGATIIEQNVEQEPADELDTSSTVDGVEDKGGSDELPEKYRGKSVAEIVRMHQEAEKLVGKQGQELGDLRRVADDYIKRTLGGDNQAGASSAPKEDEQVDFFADPQKAVTQMIERDPRIKDAAQAAEMVRRENASRQLQAKHPDAMEVAQSTDFQEWVAASKVRTKLFAQADQSYDFEAAEELISTFKALRPKAPEKVVAAPKSDSKSGKMMPRPVTGGSEGDQPSKKIYRRADIIKLQQVDPQRYLDMQDEIMHAYAEGRVR